MPVPPRDIGWFNKVNYVIDAWSQPCEAPWYIYISTLKPALLTAFITLITFGWDDVARGYFRPRSLGVRRTGKRKGKFSRGLRSFPELGEELGKRLPGADEVKGKKWGVLGNALWRIDTQIQQGLFWWLVADVTNDLAYNWTSVLYETRWCQESARGRFSYQSDRMELIAGGGPRACTYNIRDYQHAPPFWTLGWGQSGVNGCQAFGSCTLEPAPGFPNPNWMSVNIANLLTGKVYAATGREDTDVDGKMSMAIGGNVPPFTQFVVNAEHDAPFALYGLGIVTAIEAKP